LRNTNEPIRRKSIHAFENLVIPEDAVGIHWFGQSSFALKDTVPTIVLVDPYFPRNRPLKKFIHPISPLDEEALKVDYVLLTHDHGDHTCTESLLRIRSAFPSVRYYGPEECIARLRLIGFPEEVLSTVTAGEIKQLGSIAVNVVWSKLPEGLPKDGIPVPDVTHLGYVLEFGSVRVYVSGDLFHTAAEHDEFLEPIRQLKPDIGLLTFHPTEEEFPNFEGSVVMAKKLKLKAAVPAHYGCFRNRTYDPYVWASLFPSGGPKPIIISYNKSIVFNI